MLKRVNKEQICCPVVFFEEIWGGKYPAGPRASCLFSNQNNSILELTFSKTTHVLRYFTSCFTQKKNKAGPLENWKTKGDTFANL